MERRGALQSRDPACPAGQERILLRLVPLACISSTKQNQRF